MYVLFLCILYTFIRFDGIIYQSSPSIWVLYFERQEGKVGHSWKDKMSTMLTIIKKELVGKLRLTSARERSTQKGHNYVRTLTVSDNA